MMTELFADTLGRVDFSGGVVRLDLVSLEPDGEGQGRMQQRQRVVMPIDGFLHAFSTMGNLIQKLVEAGVVQRDGSAPPVTTPVAAAVPAAEERPASPNFAA